MSKQATHKHLDRERQTGSVPIDGVKQLVAQPTHRFEVGPSASFSRRPTQRPLGGPMYKHAYQVLIALTLFAVLMVPVTQAQSITLRAEIPFDFAVGNKWLPAGEYLVNTSTPGVMLIQSKDASSSAFAMTTAVNTGKPSDVSKLVFNRYGEQYFLSKIWIRSSDTGRALSKSRFEREVAAQSKVQPAAIVVAAK
jgi:hypothetical protein